MIAMEKRYYFDKPKQVVFADPENPGDWLCGIAYRDEVICSCCGGVFEIDEVVKMAAEDGVINPFYSYEDKFTEEMEVTHIALAIHKLNVETNIYGRHMNIHEFQAFTPEYYTARDTEEVNPSVTEDVPPAKEPLSVSDILPKSPVAITAVASVLATVCAVGCVWHDRKKEKKY